MPSQGRDEMHHGAAYLADSAQLFLIWCTVNEIWKQTKCMPKIANLKWQ